MTYATVAQAKRAMQANQVNADDDERLYQYLIEVTDRITGFEFLDGIGFEPLYDAKQFLIRPTMVDSYEGRLDLPWPLLIYTSMTINGTSVTSSQADTGGFDPPYKALYLTDDCSCSWYSIGCSAHHRRLKAIVAGAWGYRIRYSDDAWQDSQDTVQDAGGINAVVTTVTVTDADGADFRGFTPRFSPGQLIAIGDEYLRVDAVDTTGNTLTVRRGVNGTTAAAHALGATINTYYPDARIVRATGRQAGLLYARRGAYDARSADGMGGETVYPQDLLSELKGTIQSYVYEWA